MRSRPNSPKVLDFEPVWPGGPAIDVRPFAPTRDVSHPPHGHRFFEVVFVSRGEGTHRVGDQTKRVRGGDLLVIAPGEIHQLDLSRCAGFLATFQAEAVGARSDAALFLPMPNELLLSAFLRPQGAFTGHFRLGRDERAEVQRHLRALRDELGRRKVGYVEAARARLALVLILAARRAAPALSGVPLQARPLLAHVFELIEANHLRPISLEDVARGVGKSPAYLTDFVKKRTGRSVLEWIIARRLATARALLLETELSVEDISERISYLDPGHFIRQFRRAFGMTPQAWRRAQFGHRKIVQSARKPRSAGARR